MAGSIMEALNKSVPDFSEHEKQKRGFCFSSCYKHFRVCNMAVRPCTAGISELFRDSLATLNSAMKMCVTPEHPAGQNSAAIGY